MNTCQTYLLKERCKAQQKYPQGFDKKGTLPLPLPLPPPLSFLSLSSLPLQGKKEEMPESISIVELLNMMVTGNSLTQLARFSHWPLLNTNRVPASCTHSVSFLSFFLSFFFWFNWREYYERSKYISCVEKEWRLREGETVISPWAVMDRALLPAIAHYCMHVYWPCWWTPGHIQ